MPGILSEEISVGQVDILYKPFSGFVLLDPQDSACQTVKHHVRITETIC